MENRIGDLRKAAGLSLAELAKRCGITKTIMIKAEHMSLDNCNIRLKTLIKISEGLDVPLSEVLGIDRKDIKKAEKVKRKRKRYIVKRSEQLKQKREKVLKKLNG